MDVGNGFVEAPGHIAVAPRNGFGIRAVGCALYAAVACDTAFRTDQTVQHRGTQTVKEPVPCGSHADRTVVAGVGIRQYGFRTVFFYDFIGFLDEDIPCLVPGDALPLSGTLFPYPHHRVQDPVGCIGVFHVRLALHAGARPCLELLLGAAHKGHASVLDAELHETAVSAVSQATVVLHRPTALIKQHRIGANGMHCARGANHEAGQAAYCNSSPRTFQ